jgi:hypothetical protein
MHLRTNPRELPRQVGTTVNTSFTTLIYTGPGVKKKKKKKKKTTFNLSKFKQANNQQAIL